MAGLFVFAVVRCGQPWMSRFFGRSGPYVIATVLFIALGGGILSRLVIGLGRLRPFYPLFGLAFFSYAASWVMAYVTVRGLLGELLGSVIGSCLMGLVLCSAFGARELLPKLAVTLLLTISSGYFLGRLLHVAISGSVGMILFGACYGLGVGAGLGYALFLVQEPVRKRLGTNQYAKSRTNTRGSEKPSWVSAQEISFAAMEFKIVST